MLSEVWDCAERDVTPLNWLSIILSDCYSQLGHTSDSFFKHLYVLKTLYNPNFSFHILSTPLSTFPLLLTKRMYLTIKAFRLMITSYDRNDWMIMISSVVREIWCWSLLGFKELNLRYHILGIDGGGLFEDKHNWVENANCITYNSAGCSLQVTSTQLSGLISQAGHGLSLAESYLFGVLFQQLEQRFGKNYS